MGSPGVKNEENVGLCYAEESIGFRQLKWIRGSFQAGEGLSQASGTAGGGGG